ncbi:hypothetical protein Z043_122570, partial [Scleropages formosus]
FNLTDSFRKHRNTTDQGITWRNSRGACSPLDYILASPSVTFKKDSMNFYPSVADWWEGVKAKAKTLTINYCI